MHGYGVVKKLCAELKDFMKMHNFSRIEDFRGYKLFERIKFLKPCDKFPRHDQAGQDSHFNFSFYLIGLSGLLFSILPLILTWYEGSKKQFDRERQFGKACSRTKIGLETVL